jgi:predicted phage-related endonuclease
LPLAPAGSKLKKVTAPAAREYATGAANDAMHKLATASPQVNSPYVVIGDADADRAAWLEARRGLITAGEVPLILGMYGPSRRIRYWYDKAELTQRESLDDFEGAQMGHRLEPLNAELFTEKTRRKLRREQKLLQSTRYPWLGATLDYTQYVNDTDPGVPVELKSSGKKHNWPETEADIEYPEVEFVGEPSLRYQAQLQAQLVVYGADWGSVSVLLGTPYMHHRWRDFPLHSSFSTLIIEKSYAFWQSIQRGDPPEPDDSDLVRSTLKERALQAHAGGSVRLPAAAADWDRRLIAARAAQIEAHKEINHLESLILTALGDAEQGILPDGDAYVVMRSPRKGYTVAPTTTVTLRRVRS